MSIGREVDGEDAVYVTAVEGCSAMEEKEVEWVGRRKTDLMWHQCVESFVFFCFFFFDWPSG